MTYDETWDPGPNHRVPVVALAVLAALLALAVSAFVFVRQTGAVDAERAAQNAEMNGLARRVEALEQRNSTLSGRLGSAEKALKRRETGIAPLASRVLRSVFTVQTENGLGSGFVAWTEGGASYLVTANHVVEGQLGSGVTISRKGRSWSGDIDTVDPTRDLAVIRIEGRPAGATPLWQNSHGRKPRTGDQLLLVGSPYGLYGSVTTGIVSRVTPRAIQTDAAANPGNSGGPALDQQGHVVGVLVSGGGENINFAVPISLVCARLRHC